MPTLPKIFRPITRITLIFLFGRKDTTPGFILGFENEGGGGIWLQSEHLT